MHFLMSGEAEDSQIGSALTALKIKGVSGEELAAFASVMRANAQSVEHGLENVVDTCGTGGGSASFNISTSSAIVAAAAGVKIAKHGNRAVTSKCGSADVLELLGVPVSASIDTLRQVLLDNGIVFLFAPAHHPAMKYVGKTRKELGFRTVFNQLGPLANPANAKRQLMGVYDPDLLLDMGDALRRLGTERAVLAHGFDGLDEISPVTPTHVVRVWDGEVVREVWKPEDFGLKSLGAEAIAPGESVTENAAIFKEAISKPDSPRCLAILPSAATAIWIADLAPTLKEAVNLARDVVASGAALHTLDRLAVNS